MHSQTVPARPEQLPVLLALALELALELELALGLGLELGPALVLGPALEQLPDLPLQPVAGANGQLSSAASSQLL